jgi:hypothetical protein
VKGAAGRQPKAERFGPVVDALGELRAAVEATAAAQQVQYEQLLAAQRRTNHLLELALQAAFEDEEQLGQEYRPG